MVCRDNSIFELTSHRFVQIDDVCRLFCCLISPKDNRDLFVLSFIV